MTTKRTRPTSLRLVDLQSGWVSWLKVKNHRPRGILTYAKEAAYIIDALGGPAATTADLTWERLSLHLADLAERGVGPATIAKRIAVARSFGAWLVKAGHLDRNVALDLDRPRRSSPIPRALSRAELRGVWDLLSTPIETIEPWWRWKWQRDMRILALGLLSGMRLAEIAALTWKCVDLEAGILQVLQGKGGKDRLIPIHERLRALLETVPPEARRSRAAVAGRRDGACMSYKSVAHTFDRFVRLALPDVSCHRLRHAFATEALRAGADLKVISELMGHADISTTSMYLKVDVREKRAAIAKLPNFGQPDTPTVAIEALRAHYAPAARPDRAQVACAHCGELFTPNLQRPSQRFCRVACGTKYRRAQKRGNREV